MRWALVAALVLSTEAFAQDKGPFEHLKYRSIGPFVGGRASRACGVPGDPSTYYAAMAHSGVWKSSDGGLSWKPIFDDQPCASVGAIAVAPSDPNVVYVGTGEANIRGNVIAGNGIYKSSTAGKNWSHVWKERGQIGRIVVHPRDPNIAFAAVLGRAFGPNPERGVYRTTDGGKTWQQVLKKDADTGAIDIAMDPANPRVLFAALWQVRRTPWSLTAGGPGSGIYRSEDGGDTWKRLGPPQPDDKKEKKTREEEKEEEKDDVLPPGPYGRVGLAIAPSDSSRIYALIEADKGGLYASQDGGEHWKLINSARYLRIRPWYFSVITVDPVNADIVWYSGLRLLRSMDGGKSFRNVKGPHHVDHHDLWIDPKNPSRMIDSNDGGLDLTSNGGESWLAPALPTSQFYHVSVDNRVPYHVAGTVQDTGTLSGPSNSLSSEGIGTPHWHTVGGGETGFTAPDPSDPNIVYAGEYGGYLSRYDHRTRQAHTISVYPIVASGKGAEEVRYRFNWTAPLLVSTHDSKNIYHGANVLFKTSDAGKTWNVISLDLTRNDRSKQQWSGGPITGDNTGAEYYCTLFALSESPLKQGLLWAGSDDGLVHVSTDDGTSWSNVTKNIPGLPEWGTVSCVEPSPHDASTAYVVVDAHRLDDHKPYLWVTRDLGKSWKSLGAGLPEDNYLNVVREDPKQAGMLYVGTVHGVHYSHDGGTMWKKLQLNLPTVAVTDLKIKNNDLVVCTSGRSLWIFDDLTPVRSWKDKSEATLFPTQPAIRWRYHSEVYGTEEKAGDNPPRGAIVNFLLPKKPQAEVVLDIFDAKGTLVRQLTSRKPTPEIEDDHPEAPDSSFKPTVLPTDRGLRRINWDLTATAPEIIPGAKSDAGIPKRGPLVVPGSYTLKLTVDGTPLTTSLKVEMDPRVKMSDAAIQGQYDFALKLRDDVSKLSKTVIALQQGRRQLQARLELWKDDPKAEEVLKTIRALSNKLDVLESEFHNPRAEVTYDILAFKGGAKLYSQLIFLYETVKDSDGPLTQGMRTAYAEHSQTLQKLLQEWTRLSTEISAINDQARSLNLPYIALPKERTAPRGKR